MPLHVLTHAGLTEREAEIYEALLKLGDVPVAELSKALGGVHPQIVYRVLEALEMKRLVTSTVQKHRRFVRAEDPRKLEYMEEKRLEELRKALPELEALRAIPRGALVRIERGNEAVKGIRERGYNTLGAGETYYIMGASGDRFYEVLGVDHARLERRRLRKKIRRKLLAFECQRPGLSKDLFRKFAAFRYLPDQYASVSSTNIFKDTTAIFIWTAEPVAIAIESPEVAASYRHHFAALWKVAKP